ncbi:DUF3124 domain-containing protein [Rubrivirga sp. IMCC45206]|uniref:DUF3124 domain-containing protein n=1 Tax=Rubrivirga sp. IMCC45206 TaxID=3391614 RepID=UPI003990114E
MTSPRLLRYALALALLGAVGCADPAPAPTVPAESAAPADTSSVGPAVIAETVYVPAYSHIYSQDGSRKIDLSATLSIRNTDPDRAIRVRAVRYVDSDGRLVRTYGDDVMVLPPLASRAFVVEERDLTGGVGASFLVDWEAGAAVSAPIIEAVMISTAGAQGISFVTRGTTVRPLAPTPAE